MQFFAPQPALRTLNSRRWTVDSDSLNSQLPQLSTTALSTKRTHRENDESTIKSVRIRIRPCQNDAKTNPKKPPQRAAFNSNSVTSANTSSNLDRTNIKAMHIQEHHTKAMPPFPQITKPTLIKPSKLRIHWQICKIIP